MNKVVLIGRWTRDLELKFTPGTGTAVAKGILAVDRRFSKDRQKKADFIPVVIWGKIAENAVAYTGKGKLCGVCGRLQIRSYDGKDGTKKYATEVIADEVQFLEWIKSNGDYQGDLTPVDDGEVPF